jgi:hypothetical protein
MALERTGVVVVRAWLEKRSGRFRARVTEKPDLAEPGERSVVVATPAEAAELVRDFLEAFNRDREPPDGR